MTAPAAIAGSSANQRRQRRRTRRRGCAAVVHELPVTRPTSAADRRAVAEVEQRRAEQPEAVVDDRRDRAGHVPGADQRADGEQDEDRPHIADVTPPIAASADPGDRVTVLERDRGWRTRRSAAARPGAGRRWRRSRRAQMVRASSTIRTTIGRTASSMRSAAAARRLATGRPTQALTTDRVTPSDPTSSPRWWACPRAPRRGRRPRMIATIRPGTTGRRSLITAPSSDRVALDGAGHAVPAAAALAELEPCDRDDLDARPRASSRS